jgi:DNA-binding response OmpR family regulator
MTLESLLLSHDPELVRVIRPTLEKLSIDVEICPDARSGSDILISDKFDAVIVDCDDLTGGLALLQGLRNTPSNKNSVAFAILNGKRTTTQEAFGMGSSAENPSAPLNASRCFHAALNFMLKERRRYFRQPVKMQVKVAPRQDPGGQRHQHQRGGIACCCARLAEGATRCCSSRCRRQYPSTSSRSCLG